MRAMILSAGLGTRMRPLSNLRPKPAMPVQGIPVLAWNLALLARHGIHEIILNTHVLPDAIAAAAKAYCPAGIEVHFSHEPELLDTGGGLLQARSFLEQSSCCVVLAGDMLLDLDLSAAIARHRRSGRNVTFLLRDDPRTKSFGSIGIDEQGRVRRIGSRFDLGGEARKGLFITASIFSTSFFKSMPEKRKFGFLDDWIMPLLKQGAEGIEAECLPREACTWDPVGTLQEYLDANFHPYTFDFINPESEARKHGTRLEAGLIAQPGASIGAGARLERVVVWENEVVPAGFRAKNGVFAGGLFHACDSSD